MEHLALHLLLRLVKYPLYWVGLIVIKGLTLGRANTLPYSELDQEDDADWGKLRVRFSGFTYWRPEGLIIVGGCSAVTAIVGIQTCRYLI